MGKHNNNFEYYKPQNGNSFVPSESDSDDCKDSDSKAMFSLPRRKVIRGKGSSSKRSRQCCRVFCNAVIPLIIAIFIIGTLTSVGYILLGVNGMKRQIELLKIQLNKVQSEEKSDLLQSKNLQKSVSKKMSSIEKDEDNIKKLQAKVILLSTQIKTLNITIAQLKEKHDPSDVPPSSVINDVKLLKKGMADTGGEIKKLSDDSEGAKKTLALVSKLIKSVRKDVMKLRKSVSEWDRNPLPTEPVDTLKPFEPTISPVDKAEKEKKSMRKVTTLLKKLVNGYSELFKNKTEHLAVELKGLKTVVKRLNTTHRINFMSLEHDIAVLNNVTKKQKNEIKEITTQLESGPTSTANTSSSSKVLTIVKDLFNGLKKHQSLINDLTKRIDKAEKFSEVEKEEQKNEPKEVVTAEAITTPIPQQTTDAPDLTTKPQVTEEIVKAEHPKYSTERTPKGTAHITTIAPATVPSQNGTHIKLNETRTKLAAINSTKSSPLGKSIVPETGGPSATGVTKQPLNGTVVTDKPLVHSVHSLPKASLIVTEGVHNGTNPLPNVNLTEPFTTSEPAATTQAANTEELITKDVNGTIAVPAKEIFTTMPLPVGTLPPQDDESEATNDGMGVAAGDAPETENTERTETTTHRRKRPIPTNDEGADLMSTYEDAPGAGTNKRTGNPAGFPDKEDREFPVSDGSYEQDGGFVNAGDGSNNALDNLDDSA